MQKPFVWLEEIVNITYKINSAILIEQNEKVQHSSSVMLNSKIVKQCNIKKCRKNYYKIKIV